MLNIFRQGGFMKILMSGVVLLIAAAFIFDFRGGGAAATDECAVRVDTSCVPVKDYNFLLRLVPPPGTSNKQLRSVNFPQHATNALVERELLLKEGRLLGLGVSEDDVDKELMTGRVHFSWPVDAPLPQSLFRGQPFPTTGALDPISFIRVKNSKTGSFDFSIYKRQVRGLLRMSTKEFKKLQRDEILAARVRGLVTSAVRVSEEEAFSQFELNRSRATVRYVDVKHSWFERASAPQEDTASDSAASNDDASNDEAVQTAWDATKDQWTANCPLVSEVLLRFPPGADAEQRAAQSERAGEVQALLRSNVPFPTVARVYSDAPTAKSGGEVGCLSDSYGPVADELLKAVSEMKPGSVSAPVETAQGFHVLKFHGELAEADIESTGKSVVARRVAAEATAKLAAQSFADGLLQAGRGGKTLQDAVDDAVAAAVNLPAPKEVVEQLVEVLKGRRDVPQVTVSRQFTRDTLSIPGLKNAASAARQVFELKQDDEFVAKPLDAFGGLVVIQLKEKDIATREQFDEDKSELMRGLQEQKRADAISNYLARLREKAQRIEVSESILGGGQNQSDEADEESSETNSG